MAPKIILFFILMIMLSCQNTTWVKKPVIWKLDSLQNIDGHEVNVLGNPEIIEIPGGTAIQFNGKNEAILLDTIPVPDFTEFTIEIVFRPDSGGNKEQRFFHIQEKNDYRILMETRLVDDNQWFLDTFIKSGEQERALYAKEFLHPTGQWYHIALVYDGEKMRHFVNGRKEMEGQIEYRPIKYGETSIGCRLNRVFWFKGAIQEIYISPSALSPAAFKLSKM